jgi:hypothetical protein
LVDDIPDTQYTRLGEGRTAYQVFGDGTIDLLFVSNRAMGSIDMRWEWPPYATFLRHRAAFARLIAFDCRDMGAPDPVDLKSLPTWEEWAADAREPSWTPSAQMGWLYARRPTLYPSPYYLPPPNPIAPER